jgi:hemerythrin
VSGKTGDIFSSSKNYIVWSDSYSIGIKFIDDQHKGLLDIVNDLFSHSTGNEIEELLYFKEVIQQAVQYVKNHFQIEEKLLISAKYPGYAEHKKAHDQFTLTVVSSAKDFESGKRLVLEKFAYFLKDWILSHIAVMDKQYAAYLRKIATRNADGKLVVENIDVG